MVFFLPHTGVNATFHVKFLLISTSVYTKQIFDDTKRILEMNFESKDEQALQKKANTSFEKNRALGRGRGFHFQTIIGKATIQLVLVHIRRVFDIETDTAKTQGARSISYGIVIVYNYFDFLKLFSALKIRSVRSQQFLQKDGFSFIKIQFGKYRY